MSNRYCMLCGELLSDDGVCLRCGTKYELMEDGTMTVLPRKVKRVTAKAIPNSNKLESDVSIRSESESDYSPAMEDVYSYSDEIKRQEKHVDWTNQSEENEEDVDYKPDFVLVDEAEVDWDDTYEEEPVKGETFEPELMDQDDEYYDDSPVFDNIYVSTSSQRRGQTGNTFRKRLKKRHPFLKMMLLLVLCGGLLYLFKIGVFTPLSTSNDGPRTVSMQSTLRVSTSRETSTSQTTKETAVEATTKGPEYSDVEMLTRITSEDYTIYANYDVTNKTLKTNNWESYLAEDDAYNTCIQSREILDTGSSKSDYLDYIIFFAPYNQNILNGMVKKVVEEDGDIIRSSELLLGDSRQLKSIKTYENGRLVDTAEYEYTETQIVIRHGSDRFVLDKNQKSDLSHSIQRNNDNKVTHYVIEVMEDMVTSQIEYDAGKIKHIKTTTKYYVDNPDDYGVAQSYSGINVSNTYLSYSTYSIPILK